ncbi:MAG: TonB-dependent receptor [Sphingomonadales bacterium]|nr:TonB-dependent receptor [Sphingomonadales bacterium]MDE2170687.1 TonB-dependent receptor [Sphingomonadales bacterium]
MFTEGGGQRTIREWRAVRTKKRPTRGTNLQRVPGWTHVDLGLRYVAVAAKHPITFRVSVENIANTRYWASAFGGYLLQGTPRTIKSSLTFEY